MPCWLRRSVAGVALPDQIPPSDPPDHPSVVVLVCADEAHDRGFAAGLHGWEHRVSTRPGKPALRHGMPIAQHDSHETRTSIDASQHTNTPYAQYPRGRRDSARARRRKARRHESTKHCPAARVPKGEGIGKACEEAQAPLAAPTEKSPATRNGARRTLRLDARRTIDNDTRESAS
jgi:hypothetical protein